MSVAVWPSELPSPVRETYGQERQGIRQRKSAGGPPGYRRRFSSGARSVTLGLELTRARKAIFDAFYDDLTKDGSLPFLMPDPTSDGLLLLDDDFNSILAESGERLLIDAQWLCLFGETVPSERMMGGRFMITFTVSVMP